MSQTTDYSEDVLDRDDRGDSNPDQRVAHAPADDAGGGLETVVVRNEFYQDGYKFLLWLVIAQACVIFGLFGTMYFVVHVHQPENRYFATTGDGRLVPLMPLTQPNLSKPALNTWVAQAATEVWTFGFNDYRRRLQEASRHFTKRGWESFTQALRVSKVIDQMEDRQFVATAKPLGAPIIKQEGVMDGRYTWIVEIPLQVLKEGPSGSNPERYRLILTVVRVPRLESPDGIGIESWIQRAR